MVKACRSCVLARSGSASPLVSFFGFGATTFGTAASMRSNSSVVIGRPFITLAAFARFGMASFGTIASNPCSCAQSQSCLQVPSVGGDCRLRLPFLPQLGLPRCHASRSHVREPLRLVESLVNIRATNVGIERPIGLMPGDNAVRDTRGSPTNSCEQLVHAGRREFHARAPRPFARPHVASWCPMFCIATCLSVDRATVTSSVPDRDTSQRIL